MRAPLSKKGQVQTIAPAILALVFATVVLVFGLVITQSVRDTQSGSINANVANESIGPFPGTTNLTLAKASECGFGDVTTGSVVIYNATNATGGTAGINIVGSGNYTVYRDGNIINLTSDYSDWAWQVSYPYTWGGDACVAGNKTVVGLGTFADFLEIIVLAIVITVVIGLLLVVFGGSGRR